MKDRCAKCGRVLAYTFIQFMGARYHVECIPAEVERYLAERGAKLSGQGIESEKEQDGRENRNLLD